MTGALHSLKTGDKLGLRGPYGRGFPLELAKGRDIVIMAGGLGLAPLRPLVLEFVRRRKDYGEVFLFCGTKTPGDLLYRDEFPGWEASGIKTTQTVDCKDERWQGCVGLVTTLLDPVSKDLKDATAYVCGPPVMIEASMERLSQRGIPDERIITTLEAHMKCGVGKCGHCYMGPRFVCTDGPVFTRKELGGDFTGDSSP